MLFKQGLAPSQSRGFTIIELLLVLAILGIITALVFFSFRGYRDSQLLNTAAEEILAVIARARSQALSSVNGSNYGVHFQSDKIIMFAGAAYPGVNPEETLLDPRLEIVSIQLVGGGSEAIFARLTGGTAQAGNLRLRRRSDTSQFRTITIESTGLTSVN